MPLLLKIESTDPAFDEAITLHESMMRPRAHLIAEADRFIASMELDRSGGGGGTDGVSGAGGAAPLLRFVALHWRHGDWVDYKLLQKPPSVVRQVREALRSTVTRRYTGTWSLDQPSDQPLDQPLDQTLDQTLVDVCYTRKHVASTHAGHEHRHLLEGEFRPGCNGCNGCNACWRVNFYRSMPFHAVPCRSMPLHIGV